MRGASRRARSACLADLPKYIERGASDSVPRYIRLRNAMLSLIEGGAWRSGDKLPGESQLAGATGLSLGTVQKALNALSADGFIVRQHGRGTFVAGAEDRAGSLWHFRFADDTGRSIVPVYARAIDRTFVRRGGPWANVIGSRSKYIRVRRLIDISGEFECLSEYYIDGDRFCAVMDLPFDELHRVMIRSVLSERFDAPTFRASQQLRCDRLPAEVCRQMNLPAGTYGLIIEVLGWTRGNAPLSYQRIFVPPGVRPLALGEQKATP